MAPKKDIYENRDMLLGQIEERTRCIPQMQRDVSSLKRKVAIVELKSGLWGVIGGILAIVGLYFKEHILNWRIG
jgi:hypothetical protein